MSEDLIKQKLFESQNKYEYVEGNPLRYYDPFGLAKFCKRPIEGDDEMGTGPIRDYFNLEDLHEQIFFEDEEGGNIGFFPDGDNDGYGEWLTDPPKGYVCKDTGYDDATMRQAVKNISKTKRSWQLIKYNCQDAMEDVREEYKRIHKKKKK